MVNAVGARHLVVLQVTRYGCCPRTYTSTHERLLQSSWLNPPELLTAPADLLLALRRAPGAGQLGSRQQPGSLKQPMHGTVWQRGTFQGEARMRHALLQPVPAVSRAAVPRVFHPMQRATWRWSRQWRLCCRRWWRAARLASTPGGRFWRRCHLTRSQVRAACEVGHSGQADRPALSKRLVWRIHWRIHSLSVQAALLKLVCACLPVVASSAGRAPGGRAGGS